MEQFNHKAIRKQLSETLPEEVRSKNQVFDHIDAYGRTLLQRRCINANSELASHIDRSTVETQFVLDYPNCYGETAYDKYTAHDDKRFDEAIEAGKMPIYYGKFLQHLHKQLISLSPDLVKRRLSSMLSTHRELYRSLGRLKSKLTNAVSDAISDAHRRSLVRAKLLRDGKEPTLENLQALDRDIDWQAEPIVKIRELAARGANLDKSKYKNTTIVAYALEYLTSNITEEYAQFVRDLTQESIKYRFIHFFLNLPKERFHPTKLEKLAQLLEQGAKINVTDHWGLNCLHIMIRNRLSAKQIKECLNVIEKDQEINVHQKTVYGENAFVYLAKSYNDDKPVIAKLLQQLGADINEADTLSETALHYAVVNRDEILVETLLALGADPNRANNLGFTPLHYAACTSEYRIVDLLCQHRANLHAKTTQGFTPADFALEYNSNEALKNRTATTGFTRVVNNIARWQVSYNNLLVLYSYAGDSKAVSRYVNSGAEIDSQDDRNNTALMAAASRGREDIAAFLLQRGADTNLVNQKGETAVHLAARKGNLAIVSRLVEHDANQHYINEKSNQTSLHAAILSNELPIVAFLLQRGALNASVPASTENILQFAKQHDASCYDFIKDFVDGILTVEDLQAFINYQFDDYMTALPDELSVVHVTSAGNAATIEFLDIYAFAKLQSAVLKLYELQLLYFVGKKYQTDPAISFLNDTLSRIIMSLHRMQTPSEYNSMFGTIPKTTPSDILIPDSQLCQNLLSLSSQLEYLEKSFQQYKDADGKLLYLMSCVLLANIDNVVNQKAQAVYAAALPKSCGQETQQLPTTNLRTSPVIQ